MTRHLTHILALSTAIALAGPVCATGAIPNVPSLWPAPGAFGTQSVSRNATTLTKEVPRPPVAVQSPNR